jgi:hypothetical protein
MTNYYPLENKSRGAYEGKTCYRCGINGSIRKYNFVVKYSFKIRLCCFCIEKLGGSVGASQWAEENVIFNKEGKIIEMERE